MIVGEGFMGQMVLDLDFKEKAALGSRETKLSRGLVKRVNTMCSQAWGRPTGLELKIQSK